VGRARRTIRRGPKSDSWCSSLRATEQVSRVSHLTLKCEEWPNRAFIPQDQPRNCRPAPPDGRSRDQEDDFGRLEQRPGGRHEQGPAPQRRARSVDGRRRRGPSFRALTAPDSPGRPADQPLTWETPLAQAAASARGVVAAPHRNGTECPAPSTRVSHAGRLGPHGLGILPAPRYPQTEEIWKQ
jgi:hypothetical protein